MSVSENDLEVWKNIIEWLVEQDGFVLIGIQDGVVNAKTSVGIEDAYEMTGMVCDMLANSSVGDVPASKMVQ